MVEENKEESKQLASAFSKMATTPPHPPILKPPSFIKVDALTPQTSTEKPLMTGSEEDENCRMIRNSKSVKIENSEEPTSAGHSH